MQKIFAASLFFYFKLIEHIYYKMEQLEFFQRELPMAVYATYKGEPSSIKLMHTRIREGDYKNAAGIAYTVIKANQLLLVPYDRLIVGIEEAYSTFHEWIRQLRAKPFRFINPNYWIALLDEKEVNRQALRNFGRLDPENAIGIEQKL